MPPRAGRKLGDRSTILTGFYPPLSSVSDSSLAAARDQGPSEKERVEWGLVETRAGFWLDLVGILLPQIDPQEFDGFVPYGVAYMAPVERFDIGLARRKTLFSPTPIINTQFSGEDIGE